MLCEKLTKHFIIFFIISSVCNRLDVTINVQKDLCQSDILYWKKSSLYWMLFEMKKRVTKSRLKIAIQ